MSTANTFEAYIAKRDRLQEECEALEREAGITDAMVRASEGNFIPLGGYDPSTSPAEHFADEFDYFRRHARDAYFGVENLDLRRRLIAAQRRIEEHRTRSYESDVEEAEVALQDARKKAQRLPWRLAALEAALPVAVGYWAFNMVGAIAGAVGGFFLGQGAIHNARANRTAEVESAERALVQVQKERDEHRRYPECFTHMEQLTGKREPEFDYESAYANVMQAKGAQGKRG